MEILIGRLGSQLEPLDAIANQSNRTRALYPAVSNGTRSFTHSAGARAAVTRVTINRHHHQNRDLVGVTRGRQDRRTHCEALQRETAVVFAGRAVGSSPRMQRPVSEPSAAHPSQLRKQVRVLEQRARADCPESIQ